ncbi:gp58-like family protein [Leuconostoc mesenteroides]|uniref:gp58-like family protein n=1 Tax=Leuconostoc mesenteroides TaxID=1245 RepID=UPI0023601AA9|nr:gp58-like family protein [Leuconostoc mesenteroides]
MGNVAVYKKGTTNFFSQGLGLLSDVVSSNLTQTVSSTGNVGQKLEVEYPIDGYLVSELVEGAILRISVSTNKSDYGVFEIVDTLKDDSGTITVYGDPYYNRILRMSFDNGGVFTKFSSVQSALDAAKQNITGFPADFNLISNLNTSVDLSENTYDTFGTFLEALNSAAHGNIKYSLNSIQIYSAIGKDITDITLRDDMNTSSVKITTDFSGIINKVIPVLPVQDKEGNATDQTKVGTIVTSKYSNQFLDYWAGKVINFDTQDLANTYFDRTKADRPVQTVDVDPIGLDDDFSTINIFDTIELYSTRLDYTDKMRVSERVFDTLSENVTSFKLGSSSVNIFNQINEQNDEIFNNVVKLTNAAISANGKGIDYFGQAKPSSPKEGDTWFWDDGTDFGIKQYTNGEWVDLVSSNTADKIEAGVTEAVSQAKSHTDEVKQSISRDIETAKSQAASLANAAEANAKSEAVSQFNRAQNALSDAKTDLTKSIASEASKAVAAANSQAQTYANQAKSDALNTIAKEVTDRQNAVSALDTKATNAVNQAKSDITDTINAISVGGRNLALGTAKGFTGIGLNQPNVLLGSRYSLAGGKKLSDLYNQYGSSGYLTISFDWVASGSTISGTFNPMWNNNPWNGLANSSISPSSSNLSGHYEYSVKLDSQGYSTGIADGIQFRQDNLQGNVTISNLKLEAGNKATDWTPAPEDVVLDYTTKDEQIKATITQYQTTNDGKVIKAQTDATTALGQVATKVSQTDYDKKTGDLSTKYTEVKQTADSQAADIVDIKATATSQASKINSISSDVDGTKQSISDIEKTQGSQSDKINQITSDVNGTKQSITDIQTQDDKQDTRMGTIETSVSGVKSDFSSYKTTNDGVVKTAQTTAQTAVDGLKTKVSQTDYDKKTGQLQTDLTSTTQTADQAKTDIASIKQKDGEQDEKMNTIVSDANGTKQTVSDLKTAQGKLSGDISTLQQRADGFDATVTKVNNLAVGGRNLIVRTGELAGYIVGSTGKIEPYGGNAAMKNFITVKQGDQLTMSGTTSSSENLFRYGFYDADGNVVMRSYVLLTPAKTVTTPAGATTFRISYPQSAQVKLERGNIATDWTPAPEDVDNATAKAQLTADNAGLAISDYKTNADGRIRQAQADIKANANSITQKVSQTDYDQKTGDLDTRVTKTQTTADGVVTTVGNYQTSNDKRVEAAESAISQNSKDITLRATTSDLNSAKSDLNSSISKVKITADSISNFVRDSSGNISSDFQTALSKTSIITDSTLASSIQKQTATQITSALTDNNKNIIAMINLDTSGVKIAGKNIVLDGNTTVTGDFYAKGGNFKNLNASNLTVGTLNGNQVNITNINANNIVSGAISGANLNINLNNGSVVFQKGRINSSDYTTDINIDQGYISTANDNTRALIKQGMIQLVAPNRFDLESSPYMEISNNRGQNTAGAAIVGRDSVSISNSKNAKNIFPTPLGEKTFSGLYTGQAFDGGWLPTKVAGANRGVVVAGGTETTWQVVNNSPYIFVGTDAGGSYSYGNRVAIQAEYLHAETVYYHYASGGGNVYISSDGALLKSSSATKYKTNIEHETDSIQGDQLLTIDPATWNDKFESEQLERYHETGVEPERQINMEGKRYYGIIAEDLVKAGLEELVTRNEETDEVEGVEYSKIGVALIPIVRDLRNKLNEQAVEIERLKDKNK